MSKNEVCVALKRLKRARLETATEEATGDALEVVSIQPVRISTAVLAVAIKGCSTVTETSTEWIATAWTVGPHPGLLHGLKFICLLFVKKNHAFIRAKQ